MNKSKEIFVNTFSNILEKKMYISLVEKLNRHVGFDMSTIRDYHLEHTSNASLVQSKYIEKIFKTYYEKDTPQTVVPNEKIASAYSYVPYIRGVTKIIIFNFFRQNYGIKDPILYRYTILDLTKVVYTEQLLLSANSVHVISDPFNNLPARSLPEQGNVIVEAFHPRIKTIAGQLRFFAIYIDSERQMLSGVHSNSIRKFPEFFKLSGLGHRSYGINSNEYQYNNVAKPKTKLLHQSISKNLSRLSSESRIQGGGYIIQRNANGGMSGIWHDGPLLFQNKSRSPKKIAPVTQGFFVPNFQKNMPLLYVGTDQVGFQANNLKINLFDQKGDLLATKISNVLDSHDLIDFRSVFPRENIDGPVNVIAEYDVDVGDFDKPPAGYLHIYYRGANGFSDQVHSHPSPSFYDNYTKSNRSYRCLKFAPLLQNKDLECIYSIVNINGKCVTPDYEIKIRIWTDKQGEFVFPWKVDSGKITNIYLDTIMPQIRERIDQAGIFQIEADTVNFLATWFIINKHTHSMAVDHFSGG